MKANRNANRELGILEGLALPAVRNYVFTGIIALVLFYAAMAERYNDVGAILTLFVAIPGLIFRWVISPVLFLILTTYLLIDPNFVGLSEMLAGRFGGWGRYYGRFSVFSDALLSASVLIYLMANFRVLSLVHRSMPDDPPPRRKGQPEPQPPRRPIELFAERELGIMLGLAAFAVFLGISAWQLLSSYERGENLGGTWGITQPFARLMLFLWSIGTLTVLTGAIFRHLALQRMSRLQARLLLQDLFWRETRREQERIHRWRRWARKGKPKGSNS